MNIRTIKLIIILMATAACLTACGDLFPTTDLGDLTLDSTPTATATAVPTAEPTSTPTATPTSIPTPAHSALYVPGVSVEDVITYFNEVCLDAEFVNSGDATRVQKWTTPIRYVLNGNYTDMDLQVLGNMITRLNTIEGFPGMYEAEEAYQANLRIHFCTQQEMIDLLGSNFANMDGGVTFWYSENRIYDEIICYRWDIGQHVRNSVILEEIYNGLGPVQDTNLRPDSIIYAGYSEPQSLTQVDELILKLLYHPDIKCGMNAEECETVIRRLYY